MGKKIAGILLNVIIAVVAILISKTEINKVLHVSSLLYAIIIGMLIANFTKFAAKEVFQPGIKFTSKTILRLGVILLGVKISIDEIQKLNIYNFLYIGLLVLLTILIVKFVAKKMGLEEKLGICLAAGTAICGASAIAAIGPIIEADEEDTAFGIGAITFFGTIAMFVFPILYRTLHLQEVFYGVWVGMSLPEVAEVVAAGGAVDSATASGMAMATKLTRVLYLVPVSIGFTIWQERKQKTSTNKKKIEIPYYVLGFIVVVVLNLLNLFEGHINQIKFGGEVILTTAMASLGLKTNIKKMIEAGIKPLLVGIVGVIVIQTLSIIGAYFLF